MAAAGSALPDALGRATVENTGLDETMDMIRDTFRKFAMTVCFPMRMTGISRMSLSR